MCQINYTRLLVTVILVSCVTLGEQGPEAQSNKGEEVWQQDLSDAFNIDPSTNGIKQVNLKCGSNSMLVQLETEDDFTGVMYTRGSFYKQSEPCFTKPKNGRARSLEMRFPFDQCQTIQNGDVFSNVVVVQHDPELVTPGDAAFSLECDFRKARSLEVKADFQARDREASGSSITLTSPDPSAIKQTEKDEDENAVRSETNSVTFIPTHSKTQGEQRIEVGVPNPGECKHKDN
ncbi:unnamed protein product [Hermetia illucens]|uniref:ZP domain-containing protein n=1 Tax=Hermetia illucens TaxID=343691 RepID=A0A7R8V728_HERIL|nr:unnamed protein product [Hermetia illucens]